MGPAGFKRYSDRIIFRIHNIKGQTHRALQENRNEFILDRVEYYRGRKC